MWSIFNIFQTRSQFDTIREYAESWLKDQNRICSDEDLQKIVKIFQKCKNGIPEKAKYQDDNGYVSYGFYIGILNLEQHETDAKLFFQILEIDQKIGWTNPNHVEEYVFVNKGIKIIEDQNVSLKNRILRISSK